MVLRLTGEQELARMLMPKYTSKINLAWYWVNIDVFTDPASKKPMLKDANAGTAVASQTLTSITQVASLGEVRLKVTITAGNGNTLRSLNADLMRYESSADPVTTSTSQNAFLSTKIRNYVKTASNDFTLYLNLHFRRR